MSLGSSRVIRQQKQNGRFLYLGMNEMVFLRSWPALLYRAWQRLKTPSLSLLQQRTMRSLDEKEERKLYSVDFILGTQTWCADSIPKTKKNGFFKINNIQGTTYRVDRTWPVPTDVRTLEEGNCFYFSHNDMGRLQWKLSCQRWGNAAPGPRRAQTWSMPCFSCWLL